MSAEEYQRYIKQSHGDAESVKVPAKIKTKLKKKTQPEIMSAAEFRNKHVDQDEHDLQTLGIRWIRLVFPQFLVFAIPNAGERSAILAARMIDEGLVAGMPDVMLAYPCHGKPGLFIETKTVNGKVSDEQAVIHAILRAVGYEVAVPITFEDIQEAVTEYLNGY